MARSEKQSAEKVADSKADTKKKSEKKQDKNKKPNFFVRIGRKLKETFSELKRVTWPSFGKALASTGVVLVVVLIFMVIVTGLNTGFSELLRLLTQFSGM